MGNRANVYASKVRFESMIAISLGGRVFGHINYSFQLKNIFFMLIRNLKPVRKCSMQCTYWVPCSTLDYDRHLSNIEVMPCRLTLLASLA